MAPILQDRFDQHGAGKAYGPRLSARSARLGRSAGHGGRSWWPRADLSARGYRHGAVRRAAGVGRPVPGSRCRPARPGQLPAPATGDDSLHVLDEAIDQLARLRTPYWLGDSAVRLHALTSLIAQAQQLLPDAVHDARDQELTWTQIGELINTTAATAARRY
jgi:hypothetical protein